uniref:Cytochrome c oxidase subunit 5B, mitochondrial n=1 Tax=Trichuris muris TaxID=70415 RepID=A0A5S6QEP6_TRIMR
MLPLRTLKSGLVAAVENAHLVRISRAGRSTFQHPIEGVFGEERAELISKMRGDYNYGPSYFKRGKGTAEEPNVVHGPYEHRLIGCICEPSQLYMHYMWLRKGFPRRCKCGYWFTLVDEE